ncbi:MAG: integrase [Caballeronia sp.]|jgi:transposase-like protein|nr:integrase [Caballeronia sp.]
MKRTPTPGLARVFKRLHYPFETMLMCVRWYVAYGLSVRNLEEMMAERGIESIIRRCTVGHSNCCQSLKKSVPLPQAPGGPKLACR